MRSRFRPVLSSTGGANWEIVKQFVIFCVHGCVCVLRVRYRVSVCEFLSKCVRFVSKKQAKKNVTLKLHAKQTRCDQVGFSRPHQSPIRLAGKQRLTQPTHMYPLPPTHNQFSAVLSAFVNTPFSQFVPKNESELAW